MEFLFYVPGGAEFPPEIIHACDHKSSIKRTVVSNGPDGGVGTIIAPPGWKPNAHRVGFFRDSQTWQLIPSTSTWIGYENESRPTPEGLARTKQTDGHLVELGDGNKWLIPVARKYYPTWPCALPQTMTVDEFGNWSRGNVVAKYRDLYSVAGHWIDYITPKEESPTVAADVADEAEAQSEQDQKTQPEVTYAQLADWCVIALAVNYRVTKVEASILELLNEQTMVAIMNAVVDLPTARDLQKKREQDAQ